MSQKTLDQIANRNGMGLQNLPEEFLASLPTDCWNKVRCYMRRRHGVPATRNGWNERSRRLRALRAKLGKFYVTGAYKSPPPWALSEDVETQDRFEQSILLGIV